MRNLLLALAVSTLVASPALADVKAGVDAWSRGDYPTAIKEWRQLAVSGDADAQFNMGQAYKLGRGVPVDLKQAEDWYRRAALQGHVQAEDNYGLVMFQNGNREQALPWIEKSAGRGDPRAQYILGTALFNGDMIAKDWVRAYAYMTRASAAGLAPASSSLAQMDRFIPLDQRQKGLAIAREIEQVAARPIVAAPPVTRTPLPRAVSSPPVRAIDLPPSQPPGATFPETAVDMPPEREPVPPPRIAPRPAPVVRAPIAARPAPAPVRAPTSGRGWRVQLGAFGEEGRARALYDIMASKVPELSNLQPYLVKAGSVTRLQVGPLASSAAADRLCGTVRSRGGNCLTVSP